MKNYISIEPNKLEALGELLMHARKVVIFPHTAPDGDALGSILAWGKILKQAYKDLEINLISPDRIENYLKGLPFIDEITIYPEAECEAFRLIEEADLIFHLDHNQTSRLRYAPLIEAVQRHSAKRVLIDHHLHPDADFDLTLSYPEASSTCELVYCLIEAMGLIKYITADVATLLAFGIITDTGRFMYSCFSPELYQHFASLIALGADYPYIIDCLSYHGTLEELKLKGYVLHEKLEVYPELSTAVITLSQEEMRTRNITKGDTEGLVNLPLSVEGIDCVCFIREDKTQVKLSLRSIGELAVNEIATKGFGGGGHRNAAGAEHHGSIDTARTRFLDTLREYLNK